MKKNTGIIASSFLLLLMVSCLFYSSYITFIKKFPITKKKIEKQLFQTLTHYLAEKENVDISLKESDYSSSRYKMVLFNVTPLHFICIIDNKKLISVDRNVFANHYNNDQDGCKNSEFMQIISKIFYICGFFCFGHFTFERVDDLVLFNDIVIENAGPDFFRILCFLHKSIKK
ncbi:hypothetical protein CWI38_1125p0030 [Hamiltosporidium tvaerminnensis]|uniref:Lipoprotein n=1 Tax=Hamiltosporidium tvaerminnensis TaxID=1176355 RepID=A0A4V2JXF0_9MICR|nr:hypothetical protein CWI37_0766p0020 [Hamiltosporidium tvaerminnensis]TBU11592.1 hypothetical protein CWI38_1125p0030 [Hamiltosporidium tvaerminnensis]